LKIAEDTLQQNAFFWQWPGVASPAIKKSSNRLLDSESTLDTLFQCRSANLGRPISAPPRSGGLDWLDLHWNNISRVEFLIDNNLYELGLRNIPTKYDPSGSIGGGRVQNFSLDD
jgi:hypothetical protein